MTTVPADAAQPDATQPDSTQPEASPLWAAVSQYLDHLTVERGAAANTLASYRRDLRRYVTFLSARGVNTWEAVSEPDTREFLVALRRGDTVHRPLAESSVARHLVAVRGFHKFAQAESLVTANVASGVTPPAPPRRLPKSLPVDEVLAIIAHAGADGAAADARQLRDRALVEVLYSCGARITEAVTLDIDDLDLERRAVRLRGKGGKERVVPLGRPATEALQAYLVRGRPSLVRKFNPAVFLNVRGGRLSRQSAWRTLAAAADAAGLATAVSPHTMRHSFATHLLEGGADVRVVQELLGHASVTTTQVYTLVTVSAMREVYANAHPRAR